MEQVGSTKTAASSCNMGVQGMEQGKRTAAAGGREPPRRGCARMHRLILSPVQRHHQRLDSTSFAMLVFFLPRIVCSSMCGSTVVPKSFDECLMTNKSNQTYVVKETKSNTNTSPPSVLLQSSAAPHPSPICAAAVQQQQKQQQQHLAAAATIPPSACTTTF
jgi:hypothetical protein